MTYTATRYAVLALGPLPRTPLGYALGPADYSYAGIARAYGRTYPTPALAANAAKGVTASLAAYATRQGGFINPATAYATYVTVVPGATPVSLTLTARVRRVGRYRLLTGYVSGSGGLGNTPTVSVLTTSPVGRYALGAGKGKVVTLLPDTALGAGYVRVG